MEMNAQRMTQLGAHWQPEQESGTGIRSKE
jgi:hypothetical protein